MNKQELADTASAMEMGERPWSVPRLGTHTWLAQTNNEFMNEPTLRFSTSGISHFQ